MNTITTLDTIASRDATGHIDEYALDRVLYAMYTAQQITYGDAVAVTRMAQSINDNLSVLAEIEARRRAEQYKYTMRRGLPVWLRTVVSIAVTALAGWLAR